MTLGRLLVAAALSTGLCLAAGAASAATVKGSVTLPSELKSTRRFQGYWRVENGSVPIQPPLTRIDPVVVIEGPKGQAPAAKTVTVDLLGLGACGPGNAKDACPPPVLVIGAGSVVEFKNGDKVPHDLYIPGQEALMPMQRLAPSAPRHQKFSVPGGYEARSAQYPHIAVTIIVVDTPYWSIADDKGAFKVADVPEGKATLKVWAKGRWVHQEAIEVKGGGIDVPIRVEGTDKKDVTKDTGE